MRTVIVWNLAWPTHEGAGGGAGLSVRGGKNWHRNANINERSRGRCLLHGHGTFSTSKVAVGGSCRLAVGGGGGWQLAVGNWWRLAVDGGWQLVYGGGWQLTVGSWW